MFEFRILGPLEVQRGGERLAFRGGRERALLALLVLNANRAVSSERLAEELWGGTPPDGAAKTLRVYVSRLRQALRDPGDVLVTRPGGYLLHVEAGAIDRDRFEALLAAGREQRAAGDHRQAAGTYREALALWRGLALADVADVASAQVEAARLEEARLATVEERLDADLACGRHGELIGELEALTRTHPLQERLWAQRMTALYRCGRQAEALAVYQELRRTLGDELGIEPSATLRRLETAILRQEPDLEWPRPVEDQEGRRRGPQEPPPSIPMPVLLTEIGGIFVGREPELRQLAQLYKAAAAGDRWLGLLAGEPGVGKTRLAAELAGVVHGDGGTVLAGRCDEGLGVPYQPFVEALRHFVEHTPRVQLGSRLGRHAGELARLLPELAVRAPGLPPLLRSDPETERYRLFDAVAAWLAATSAEQPVLLVLDDLQWAAKPTLLLLRHIVRSGDLQRILVLGIYRDTELGHDHPLVEVLADLRRQGGVERFSLVGLDSSGVAAFMERAAGHALDDEDLALARTIHEETEGNPFFVREVLRHLTETKAVERRGGRWITRLPLEQLGIPEGVREVVGRRVAQLSKDANRVLRVAAVVGSEFELSVLRAADVFDDEDLFAALEEATDARLVREIVGPGARYRFAHTLVRDTLYESLSAPRRVSLHKRVAEAIEAVHAARLDDQLPALAHHYTRAAAAATAETSRAVHYATRAGERALAQLAHDEAAAYYRQALQLLDLVEGPRDETARLELLIPLGEAQRRAGDPEHRETLLAASRLAREQGNADALARAALANSRAVLYSIVGGVDEERVAALEAALAGIGVEVGAVDAAIRARLLATLALELAWSGPERRRALSDEALSLAHRVGDPTTLAQVLLTRYYAVAGPQNRVERLADTAELLALADELGDDAMRSRALAVRFRVALESADVAEADRCLQINKRLAVELGQPALRWLVGLQRTGRSLLGGRLEDAERLAEETLELGQSTGQPEALAFFVWQQAVIRFEQGRLDEVLQTVLQTAADYPGVSTAQSGVALAYAELDRSDEAREALESLARSDFATVPVDAIWLRCLTDCAAVCAHLGDTDRAAVLYSLLAPYPDQLPVFVVGTAGCSVLHYLGLLASTIGQFDDAEAHFAAAAASHERIQAPTWLARTRLAWARMLLLRRRSDDDARAGDLLSQACATARELGLRNVERTAASILQ